MTTQDFSTFKLYTKIANDLQNTVPTVAYYLKTYTVNKALEYLKAERAQGRDISQHTQDLKQWIEDLETLKATINYEIMNKEQCRQYFKDYTSNLFQECEQKYCNADYTRNLAKDFLYVSVLYDAWELIGEPAEEIKAKKNYANEARFKIMDAIVKGKTPIPTSSHDNKEQTSPKNKNLPPSNKEPEELKYPALNEQKNNPSDKLSKLNCDVTDSVFVSKSDIDKALKAAQNNIQSYVNNNYALPGVFEQPNYAQLPINQNNYNVENGPNNGWNFPSYGNPYPYNQNTHTFNQIGTENYGTPVYNISQGYPSYPSVRQYPVGFQHDKSYFYAPSHSLYPQSGMPGSQKAQQYSTAYGPSHQTPFYSQPENINQQQFLQNQDQNQIVNNNPYNNYTPYNGQDNTPDNAQQQPYPNTQPFYPQPREPFQPTSIRQPIEAPKKNSLPHFSQIPLTTPGEDDMNSLKENVSPNIPQGTLLPNQGLKALKKSKTWNTDKLDAEVTCSEAKEHCMMAISELDFVNVKEAKENIRKALKCLEKIEEDHNY